MNLRVRQIDLRWIDLETGRTKNGEAPNVLTTTFSRDRYCGCNGRSLEALRRGNRPEIVVTAEGDAVTNESAGEHSAQN